MALNFKLLGQRIREARKARGISLEELADQVGLQKESFRHIETGAGKPRLETLCAVADLLDISLDYLTGRSADLPVSLHQNDVLTHEQKVAVREVLLQVVSAFEEEA